MLLSSGHFQQLSIASGARNDDTIFVIIRFYEKKKF